MPLTINSDNYQIGNKAMANVLLLYYHIISEGGITNDQTACIDTDDFNYYDFLDVELDEEGNNLDIDLFLIRKGPSLQYFVI